MSKRLNALQVEAAAKLARANCVGKQIAAVEAQDDTSAVPSRSQQPCCNGFRRALRVLPITRFECSSEQGAV